MREVQEIDVEQIMERIRQNIKTTRALEESPPSENHVSPFDEGHVAVDLAYLHSGYDLEHVSFVSHRRVLGALVIAIKDLLRRFLTPILQRQTAYNAASARVTTHIKEWIEALARQQAQAVLIVKKQVETLERSQAQLHNMVLDLEAQRRRTLVALESQLREDVLATHSREILATERRLREEMVAAQTRLQHEIVDPQVQEILAAQGALRENMLATERQLREEMVAAQTRLQHEIVDPQVQEILAAQGALRENMLATERRLREEMLAAQTRLHEIVNPQAQKILAAQGALRENMLATESRLCEEITSHSQALQVVRQSSAAARERISGAERKLRRILYALENVQAPDARSETRPRGERPALPLSQLEPEFDYAGFEERFRGSEEELKERQRIYVQYFEGAQNVLDIGCGRGEFLELLRERGIKARGVDLDLDMGLLCRDKGLDVVVDDAFAYLAALADESIGGVFAAQVIEHLHPQRVIELVKLCHRKLEPGGALILETLNPKCLMVFADNFYKDPSHVQPAHPDTMQFLFQVTGFHQVELRFLSPVDPYLRLPFLQTPGADVEQFNQGIERLNSLLYGFQDYAVIGRKSLAGAHRDMISSRSDL